MIPLAVPIVVKNSEQTAWSTAYYCAIVRACLTACGHDENLVHAVTCWPDTAAHLTSHPGISHMTFIGSRPVAHEVAKSAAKVLTPLCVELGGKDAAIILDDPSGRAVAAGEMSRIVSIIMRGVFQSAGQNCIGIERVIAMPQAYRKLLELLEPRIKSLRLGNDLDSADAVNDHSAIVDMGAMISPASFARLEVLIADAVSQGARLLVGGQRFSHPKYPNGSYFSPTLLIDVRPDMRIAREELFAPVALLMRAETVDDTISTANDTPYGLGGSVFGSTTSYAARAQLTRVAHALKTGMVAINDFAVFYAVQLPFGGVRGSGYGRFAGEEGLRALCNAKSICIDRWPNVIKTAIPGPLDYPMRGNVAWEMGQGVVELKGHRLRATGFRSQTRTQQIDIEYTEKELDKIATIKRESEARSSSGHPYRSIQYCTVSRYRKDTASSALAADGQVSALPLHDHSHAHREKEYDSGRLDDLEDIREAVARRLTHGNSRPQCSCTLAPQAARRGPILVGGTSPSPSTYNGP
nr:putative aldehyde dehydrogenase-like protein [Quercus suber]